VLDAVHSADLQPPSPLVTGMEEGYEVALWMRDPGRMLYVFPPKPRKNSPSEPFVAWGCQRNVKRLHGLFVYPTDTPTGKSPLRLAAFHAPRRTPRIPFRGHGAELFDIADYFEIPTVVVVRHPRSCNIDCFCVSWVAGPEL
jgi:hypothetical protein